MAEFQLAPPACMGMGHVIPYLALGKQLVEAGHGCRIYVAPELAGEVTAIGCTPVIGRSFPVCPELDVYIQNLAAETHHVARLLTRSVRESDVDVMIVDSHSVGGALAAKAAGVHWCTLFVSPLFPTRPYLERMGQVCTASLQRELGVGPLDLSFREIGAAAPTHIYTWPDVFDFSEPPPGTRLTRILDTSVDLAAGRVGSALPGGRGPLAVIINSTLMPRIEGQLAVVHACLVERGYSVLVAGHDRQLAELPDCERVDFLPFSNILEVADLIVSHGGWGTISRLIASDARWVILPCPDRAMEAAGHKGDQVLLGARCAQLGVASVPADPLCRHALTEAIDVANARHPEFVAARQRVRASSVAERVEVASDLSSFVDSRAWAQGGWC